MAATFSRVTGKECCQKFPCTGSASLVPGVLVQFDESGNIAIGATNKSVAGILLESGVATGNVLVDMISAGDKVKAKGVGVTLSAASVGATFDQAAGADVASSSNKDFICTDFISATEGNFLVLNAVRGGSGAKLV